MKFVEGNAGDLITPGQVLEEYYSISTELHPSFYSLDLERTSSWVGAGSVEVEGSRFQNIQFQSDCS